MPPQDLDIKYPQAAPSRLSVSEMRSWKEYTLLRGILSRTSQNTRATATILPFFRGPASARPLPQATFARLTAAAFWGTGFRKKRAGQPAGRGILQFLRPRAAVLSDKIGRRRGKIHADFLKGPGSRACHGCASRAVRGAPRLCQPCGSAGDAADRPGDVEPPSTAGTAVARPKRWHSLGTPRPHARKIGVVCKWRREGVDWRP